MTEVHKKIQFTAPENVKGRPFTGGIYFKDGEVKVTDKDIPHPIAAEYVRRWPDRFAWVDEEKAAKPKSDKAMRPERNK